MTRESKCQLNHCLGIIYGPRTVTFKRRTVCTDPDWLCFSLIFRDRTVDISCLDDENLMTWYAN